MDDRILTEKEQEWLMKQEHGAKKLFLGFSIFCLACFFIFLLAYFNSNDFCMKRIWGYRAFVFFMLFLFSNGAIQLVNKYLKIVKKFIDKRE